MLVEYEALMLLPEALWELRKTKKHLGPEGFVRVYDQLVQLESQPPSTAVPERPAEVQQVIAAVEQACRILLKGEHCLPRSITAYLMLRRRQLPVDLVIGVKAYPFSAHAWLEMDGQVINDDPRIVGAFQVTMHTRRIREHLR